jgi:hypothetical protein
MRAPYKTFSWQLQQALGTPDPDSFTGYWLPRYVSIECESIHFDVTEITLGNQRLYLERHLGEFMADDHFISVLCLECACNVYARG